ncbi:MAG: bifunctional diaminohydroxyphosphoribosylaminopyrimidine deaminase/5-amino-6-(5-phosphoribosylamino)uracil reductase RibD [Acidimicrobiia bacterium]|nr:bifunctional diaminohydroxyphosphoribosylaminopyrimidine deaminase/5-amino-6-(5-phosphoribosylamino)uracil reductase RibD [Acidimicrobiia bacterium]
MGTTRAEYMRRALDLAARHRTHPNPKVGAVVLAPDGSVVGEGAHVAAGEPHAEVVALRQAGELAEGGTLYVTLEPCTHQGRTPPCVDAILAAGLKTVVVAMTDPDQRVGGTGSARLRQEGVEVVEGVLREESMAMNQPYIHHRETGLPLVTAKWAMTLDGAVAARDGSSRWITSPEAREDAHRLRARVDAVVVGAGTLRADDPLLTVRIEGYDGPQPRPVIIAGAGDLPERAAIWERDPLVVTAEPLDVRDGEVVVVEGDGGLPDPTAAATAIAEQGYLDVLLEGGPTLVAAWWRTGLVRRGVVYVAAQIAGGTGIPPFGGVFGNVEDAEAVKLAGVRSLGSDLRIDFSKE